MRRAHKDLRAWQAAMHLVELIYRLTDTFPKNEQYGLTSQMRRCAVSAPSNIAEGAARNGTKEFIHFLGIASGSLAELDTQLELAVRLEYCNETKEVQNKIDEVSALTLALAKSLRAKSES